MEQESRNLNIKFEIVNKLNETIKIKYNNHRNKIKNLNNQIENVENLCNIGISNNNKSLIKSLSEQINIYKHLINLKEKEINKEKSSKKFTELKEIKSLNELYNNEIVNIQNSINIINKKNKIEKEKFYKEFLKENKIYKIKINKQIKILKEYKKMENNIIKKYNKLDLNIDELDENKEDKFEIINENIMTIKNIYSNSKMGDDIFNEKINDNLNQINLIKNEINDFEKTYEFDLNVDYENINLNNLNENVNKFYSNIEDYFSNNKYELNEIKEENKLKDDINFKQEENEVEIIENIKEKYDKDCEITDDNVKVDNLEENFDKNLIKDENLNEFNLEENHKVELFEFQIDFFSNLLSLNIDLNDFKSNIISNNTNDKWFEYLKNCKIEEKIIDIMVNLFEKIKFNKKEENLKYYEFIKYSILNYLDFKKTYDENCVSQFIESNLINLQKYLNNDDEVITLSNFKLFLIELNSIDLDIELIFYILCKIFSKTKDLESIEILNILRQNESKEEVNDFVDNIEEVEKDGFEDDDEWNDNFDNEDDNIID